MHMLQQLNALGIVVLLVVMLISMVLHEAMHAWTAHFLGDPTAEQEGRLSLNPLVHIDLFATVLLPVAMVAVGLPPFFVAKPVPFRPDMVRYGEYGAALVGLAGPLTNVVLAVIGALVVRIAGDGTLVHEIALVFTQVNVAFFVFNMIPWPPLDGSRLLFAVAPRPVQQVMLQIEAMGMVSLFAFMAVYILFLGVPITNLMLKIFQWLIGG